MTRAKGGENWRKTWGRERSQQSSWSILQPVGELTKGRLSDKQRAPQQHKARRKECNRAELFLLLQETNNQKQATFNQAATTTKKSVQSGELGKEKLPFFPSLPHQAPTLEKSDSKKEEGSVPELTHLSTDTRRMYIQILPVSPNWLQ